MTTNELADICRYRTESVPIDPAMYISTESMLPNRTGIASTNSKPSQGKARLFRRGDTLISNIRPYFKKIWQATEDGCCSADVLVFVPMSCDPDYLYWLLSDNQFFDFMVATSKGTKMPRGDKTAIMHYEFVRMNIEEQSAVAQTLNPIRELINLNQRTNGYLLELLLAQSKGIYKRYEVNDEPLPSGWQWVEIGDVADPVCRGITPRYAEDTNQIILGQTCIRNNLVILENGRSHQPRRITDKWLRYGDLLINSTGVGSLGRTAQVWFEPENLVVDSHITIVRSIDPSLSLYLGFWAFAHERYIESLHVGSTGQTELPRDHVKAIRIVLPDDKTLRKFNSIAQPATEIIVANQRESKRLETLRDTLLPRLISGEIDVSEIELPTQPNNHLSAC